VHLTRTTRFSRRNLPHWEVEGGRYFVTVRCADSLPHEAIARLAGIQEALAAVEPRSGQFADLQRRYFSTMEKYLDAASGACVLRDERAACAVVAEFSALTEWQIDVPHYTVMPNHWHAMIITREGCRHSLSAVMKRMKGRSAHAIRAAVGGKGAVWQREWFDRWMRSNAELEKCVAYIRNNSVKAGLARDWSEHPWTK
jgi:putative transposase